MSAKDTKAIKAILIAAGIKISQNKLGSNRYHSLLNTSDNVSAIEALVGSSYSIAPGWSDLGELLNDNNVKIIKVVA